MTGIAKDLPQTLATQDILNSLFRKLIQISGTLYFVSDFIPIPLDFWQFFIFLASIPWLSICDPPWCDLPLKFGLPVDVMVRSGATFGAIINAEGKESCLHLLAAFHSDAAPTWRTQVFLLVLVRALSLLILGPVDQLLWKKQFGNIVHFCNGKVKK